MFGSRARTAQLSAPVVFSPVGWWRRRVPVALALVVFTAACSGGSGGDGDAGPGDGQANTELARRGLQRLSQRAEQPAVCPLVDLDGLVAVALAYPLTRADVEGQQLVEVSGLAPTDESVSAALAVDCEFAGDQVAVVISVIADRSVDSRDFVDGFLAVAEGEVLDDEVFGGRRLAACRTGAAGVTAAPTGEASASCEATWFRDGVFVVVSVDGADGSVQAIAALADGMVPVAVSALAAVTV